MIGTDRKGVLLALAGLLCVACANDAAEDDTYSEPPANAAEEAPALPPTATTAALAVDSAAQLGTYLTDDRGHALYLFMSDGEGQSTCYDACAGAWRPFTTATPPSAPAAPIRADLLGTIQRRDGTTQVTYNGWPLYHFSSDLGPGQHVGHDVEHFGAKWYLVSPSGDPIIGQERETGAGLTAAI